MTDVIPPRPGTPPTSPPRPPGAPPPPKVGFALLAIVAGTVLAAAGIVSLQAHNPGRGFSVLLALALLYGGGRYATSLLIRGTS